jgi:hypothetical protein
MTTFDHLPKLSRKSRRLRASGSATSRSLGKKSGFLSLINTPAALAFPEFLYRAIK